MKLPTASSLQLAMTCPASQALPHQAKSHTAADDGNDRHELLVKALAGQEVKPDEPRHIEWLEAVLPETEPLVGMASEVAFGLVIDDRHKGLLLGANLGRVYPEVPAHTYVGTADYYRPARDEDRVVVVDLKTGQSDVPHPKRNLQLHMLAAAAALWEGLGEATVGILQAPEGRNPWWRWHHLDALALAEVGDRLEALDARIARARKDVAKGEVPWADLATGDHCQHCPARVHCPAQTALARRLGQDPQDVANELLSTLTPESAGNVLLRVRAVRDVLKAVDAALYAYATEAGGIPLPDGRVWKKVDKTRACLDGPKTLDALTALHGLEVGKAAVVMESSKAAIERALAPVYEARKRTGEKTTKKALLEQAMAGLRAVSGVGEVLTSSWEDVEPKAQKEDADA